MIGEVCIDRKKINEEILLKIIKLLTELSKTKGSPKDEEDDIIKNKTLMTAVLSLAEEENSQKLL